MVHERSASRSCSVRPARGGTRLAGSTHVGLTEDDVQARKRRSDAFNLAFVLLGGRRAANDYLDTMHSRLDGIPRQRAQASAWGLIEAVRVMRRDAMRGKPTDIRL